MLRADEDGRMLFPHNEFYEEICLKSAKSA